MLKIQLLFFTGICISTAALANDFDAALQHKAAGRLAQAEAGFDAAVKADPTDQKALEQLAIVLSWQNKFDESIAMWRRLLALNPNGIDAKIGLARVLYWHAQRQESLRLLQEVTQQQPDHASAWILLGDVQMADNKPNDARASYLHAKRVGNGVDATLEKKIAQAVAPKAWRFDVGAVNDHYDKVRGSENSRYLQLGYTTEGKTTWYTKLEQFHYFNEDDQTASVGVYWLPGSKVLLNAEAGKSNSDPFFRPESLYSLSADWLFSDHVQPLLIYRVSRYDNANSSGTVKTLSPGIRFLFDGSNIELRYARTENLDETTTAVSSVKWNWDGESLHPYIGFTTGEEATPPLAVAKINVLSGGLVWSISQSWGVRFDLAYEDRKDTYKHTVFGVGMSYHF